MSYPHDSPDFLQPFIPSEKPWGDLPWLHREACTIFMLPAILWFPRKDDTMTGRCFIGGTGSLLGGFKAPKKLGIYTKLVQITSSTVIYVIWIDL